MFNGGGNDMQAQQDQDTAAQTTDMPDPVMPASDSMPPVGPPPTTDNTVAPTVSVDQPVTEGAELPAVVPPPALGALPSVTSTNDDLVSMKQSALQQLSPLLSHLEQSPEERFRTTMMMIQASDKSELLKTAYEAAQQITDDKVRAQALLDIVNEINYFTQHNTPESAA